MATGVLATFARSAYADSGVCATPGMDGPGGTLSGVVNTYYPGTSSATAGATSIAVGAPSGAPTPIAAGDLLLVIQMQDAAINSTNSESYGDGVAGGTASGWTDLRNAGRYEYAVAQGPIAAGSVPILGAGAGSGLVFDYTNAPAAGADGQRRFQVIRVPQYSSATLSSGLTALRWNGDVGGVLVIDVAGQLTLGGSVDLSGYGFRGGGGRLRAGSAGFLNTDFRTPATSNPNGSKGEGVAGTPRLVYNAATNSIVDTGVEGYANGSMARGAPGNGAGGGTDGNPGGNDQNSGGGGGGNGGVGGQGGNTWSSNLPRGGHGGSAVPASPAVLILGGGGGAGTRNNTPGNAVASSGGAGGGMVILRAGAINGTGTLAVDGSTGITPENDGGGGGGAGGSVLVLSQSGGVGSLTINARGGNGANAWPTQGPGGSPGNRHGPGGGGGGGVVLLSGAAVSVDVSGGIRGTTTTAADPFGATSGAAGIVRTDVSPAEVTSGIAGAGCLPELTVVKTTSTPGPMVAPAVATYTLSLGNAAGNGTATGVSLSDALPSGFTFAANSDPVYSGGATGPASISNSGTPTVPVFGAPGGDASNSFTLPGGGSVSITFDVSIAGSVAPGIYQNPADVEYTDPTRTADDQTITPGAGYASGGGNAGGSNYDPDSSTAEDVQIVSPAPALSLDKSASPTTYASVGETIGYSYLVTNSGNVPLDGPFSVADDRASDESCPAAVTLAPGETLTCTASYAIAQADLDAGSVTNTATASNALVTSAPDDETVNAVQSPALTIAKSAAPATYAAAGESIGYTYLVTNSGNTTLTGPFNVDDDLATDETCPPTPTLSPGASITCGASYAITQADLDTGSVTNTATASNALVTSPPDEETVTAIQASAIEISKQVSVDAGLSWQDADTPPGPTLVEGADPQFRLTVTNTGNVTLDNLSLTDSDFDTTGCAIPASLAPSDSYQCILTAPWALGQHTNTGTASGDFGGATYSNTNDANYLGTLPVVTDPAVTKSGNPSTAAIGDTVTFTLVVSNAGPGDAEDVVVVDPIPLFLDISSVSIAPTNPGITIGLSGNTIIFGFGTLLAGDSYTVTIRTIVNDSATPPGGANSATLTTSSIDADPDNNVAGALVTIVVRPPSVAPETGFAPGRRTRLPAQPAAAAHTELGDLWLELPALAVRRAIIGVPRQSESWDVRWLGDLAGYLEGTAFPTWSGNSVITGHVVLASGLPGPFARLDRLRYGDSIFVHAWGQRYRYEVREVSLLQPTDPSFFRHEDRAWVSLVTCQGYDPQRETYRARRLVRAVLIEVDGEVAAADPVIERGR